MRPGRSRPPARDPLLRFGAWLMGFALLVAGAVAVYAVSSRPAERAAAKSAAEPGPEALVRSDPGVDPEKEPAVAFVGPETEETVVPETAAPGAAAAEPDAPSEPKERPRPPAPSPEAPEPGPEPRAGPLPVARADWPEPTADQVEAAQRPRRYELPRGAAMALTVGSIGIRGVPVLRPGAPDALDRGVVHADGTSYPWSDTPERNVYLAGHRIGWPGTGSHLIFYRLDELSDGDVVTLKDREGRRYTYRVVDSFVVNPEDDWVTGRVRGRDLVTLQTCTGANWSKRLIVRAERVA